MRSPTAFALVCSVPVLVLETVNLFPIGGEILKQAILARCRLLAKRGLHAVQTEALKVFCNPHSFRQLSLDCDSGALDAGVARLFVGDLFDNCAAPRRSLLGLACQSTGTCPIRLTSP